MVRRICGFRPGCQTLLTKQKFRCCLDSPRRRVQRFTAAVGRQRSEPTMIDARAEMSLRRLMQQRDQLLKEAEALKNKIAGLDLAIGLIGDGHAAPQAISAI